MISIIPSPWPRSPCDGNKTDGTNTKTNILFFHQKYPKESLPFSWCSSSPGQNSERTPASCGEGQGQECAIADWGFDQNLFIRYIFIIIIIISWSPLLLSKYFGSLQVHKRFDPIYSDARMRIQKLGHCFITIHRPHHIILTSILITIIIVGEFNFFTSYMSQPKFQLETFKVNSGFSNWTLHIVWSFYKGLLKTGTFLQHSEWNFYWSGLGRVGEWHLLLPEQPPHRPPCLGHAGSLFSRRGAPPCPHLLFAMSSRSSLSWWCWRSQDKARCVSVRAVASEGVVAERMLGRSMIIFNECLADICHQSSSECLANTWKWFESTNNGRPCEDTITLTAEWENYPSREGGKTTKGEGGEVGQWCKRHLHWGKHNVDNEQCLSGHAVYTASWTAARADVHSQQRFFCLMEEGEVRVLHIINWGKVMRMSGTRNSPREIRIFRWPPTSATVVTPWQATPPMVSCLSIHSTSGFINNNNNNNI